MENSAHATPDAHVPPTGAPHASQSPTPTANRRRPTPQDFGEPIRKKLHASSRTGQACDRCKIRKMRCDPDTTGCQNCRDVSVQCLTTDRITGRAWIRGIGDKLEEENRILKARLAQCDSRLRELGDDVSPHLLDLSHPLLPSHRPPPAASLGAPMTDLWASNAQGDPLASGSYPHPSFDINVLPALKQDRGDSYLGVTSSPTLSTVKGTSLSFFSIEVDIADFVEDYPVEESYEFFMQGVFRHQSHPKAPNPPEEVARMYAEGYCRAINPFAPIVHKPDVMKLIDRIYSAEEVELKTPEIVIFHMMLASLKFQQSLRNADKRALKESHAHYAYCLSFVHELATAQNGLQDVVALCQICFYLRNLPKPGPAWIMSSWVLTIALELGFHRSAKAWGDERASQSPHEIEMGKRVWWSLYAMIVTLSGKLGRPLPLREEDFDCEIPEPLDDCLPGEDLPELRRCSFRIGIVTFKVAKVMAKMYTTIYAVRPTNYNYEQTVLSLEAELDQIKRELPANLHADKAVEEDRVFAAYCQLWDTDTRLLIRHPARCVSMDSKYIANNLQVCLAGAGRMLDIIWAMHALKSLDVVWVAVTAYLSALFTALFVYSQRTEEISAEEYARLRGNMDRWLVMVGEIGKMLERVHDSKKDAAVLVPTVETSAEKLQKTIKGIIHGILKQIHDRLDSKHQLEAIARDAQTHTQVDSVHVGSNAELAGENTTPRDTKFDLSTASYNAYPDPAAPSLNIPQHTFPAAAPTYHIPAYQPPPVVPRDAAAAIHPPAEPQMSLAEALGSYSTAPQPASHMGATMWYNFTNTAFNGPPSMGSEYSSANALMSLGGRPNGASGAWPQNVFDNGPPE